MERHIKCAFTTTVFLLCAVFCIPPCFAANPAKRPADSTDYLREMPSAERVMADFHAEGLLDTALDTAMRQIAALSRLITVIALQQKGGEFIGKPTADEQALKASYYRAIDAIKSDQNFSEAKQRRLHVYVQDQGLEGDKKIEKEVLERYFSPAWQAKYLGITANLAQERTILTAKEARATASREAQWRDAHPSVDIPLILLGVIIAAVGFSGLLWCDKRNFNRTNKYGVQEFKSYGSAFISNGVESFVQNISYLALFAGLGAVVYAFWGVVMKMSPW